MAVCPYSASPGSACGDDSAHRDQLFEIDAGVEAERLGEEHHVLGDHVAGRARRIGAAAEPAQRSIESAHAGLDRGRHVGDAEPARVVEMRQQRDLGPTAFADAGEQRADRVRIAEADRVGEPDLVDPDRRDSFGEAHHAIVRHVALDGAAERGGKPAEQFRPLGRLDAAQEFGDALEVRERLRGRAAHIAEVMALAHRHDVVELVHAERGAALRALQVRHQRRDGEAGNRERALRDLLGVGELRQQLRRHERADLDLPHAGRVLGLDPGELLVGRHHGLDVLQPVAQADLVDFDALGHGCSPYLPLKLRLPLLVEGAHAFEPVLGRHHLIIGIDLEEQRRAHIHVRAEMHGTLGLAHRDRRVVADRLRGRRASLPSASRARRAC